MRNLGDCNRAANLLTLCVLACRPSQLAQDQE